MEKQETKKQEAVPVSLDEFDALLEREYATTDFDLAAFLQCVETEHGSGMAKLIRIVPFTRGGAPAQGRQQRFMFVLQGTHGTTLEALQQTEMAYTNRELRVEPITFMAQRRQLRVLLDRRITEYRGNRPRSQDHGKDK